MSPNRIAAVSVVALAGAGLLSCGGNERDTGLFANVQVTLTQAPVDAQCLTITIAGQTHNASKSIPLALNQTTTGFLLTTAPVGPDEVTAQAFTGSCNSSPVTWEGAIAFTVVAGITNNVTVPMIHLANATVGINFQDEPHTSTTLAGSPGLSGTTDGTGAVARFSGPQDSVPDNNGNLYVTDTLNHTIRKIVISSGATTTFAGTAGTAGETNGTGIAATFSNPSGITTDGSNLYVTDTGNLGQTTGCTIRQIVISSAAVTTIGGTANTCGEADGTSATGRFAAPIGITYTNNALGPALWVVDSPTSGISTIRYLNLTSKNVVTIAGSPTTAGYADGAGNVSLFNFAHGITTDGNNLYVADSSNSVIRNIAPQGNAASTVVTTLAGSGTSADIDGIGLFASFTGPIGVTYDGAGNLYVADNPRIRKVVISNGAVLTVSGTTTGTTDGTGPQILFTVPRMLSIDSGGALYVTDSTANTVRKM